MEIIHIQLANERVHVTVLEVLGKHELSEIVLVVYTECLPVSGPVDGIPVLARVDDVEKFAKEKRYTLTLALEWLCLFHLFFVLCSNYYNPRSINLNFFAILSLIKTFLDHVNNIPAE